MMSRRKTLLGTAAALMLGTVVSTLTPEHAQADDAGAFIGGMMASRVMSSIRESSQAQQQQAYYAQQQYQQQQRMQQAAPAPQTPTRRKPPARRKSKPNGALCALRKCRNSFNGRGASLST